jgi:type I restriction enzyme S subunit
MSEIKVIPKGWEVKRLGELCLNKEGLRRGPFGSAIKKEFFVPDGFKVYEQSNAIYDDITRGRYFINEEKYNELIAFNVKPGDLIVSCSGTLGKIAEIPNSAKPGVINQALLRIRLIDETISKKYFLYFFRSAQFQRKIFAQSQGTAMSNLIGIKDFKEIELTLPPLPEQQAIVAKIEELLSELDNGKQQLQTALQQLKVYRQSLLKWAFEGKLTNDNVKDGELPEDWKLVKIEDIGTVGTGATPLKGNRQYYENGKIAWVTSGALNNEFVRDASDYVTELALKETNLSVYPKNTLLLAMYGEGKTRGKCSQLLIEAATNQAIAAIHFTNHDEQVRPFLKYFLLKNYNDIRRLSSGGVQPNLNLGIVKKTLIPLPSIKEQQLIVDELESKLTVCDKVEETIKLTLQQAETLRQSILKQAFEGKLV